MRVYTVFDLLNAFNEKSTEGEERSHGGEYGRKNN